MTWHPDAPAELTEYRPVFLFLCLQELNLLDEQNNPLTHAKYHQEKVREAGERERRPCRVEIPEDLGQRIRDYLTQVSLRGACIINTVLSPGGILRC